VTTAQNNIDKTDANWTGRTARALVRYNNIKPHIPLWRRVLMRALNWL